MNPEKARTKTGGARPIGLQLDNEYLKRHCIGQIVLCALFILTAGYASVPFTVICTVASYMASQAANNFGRYLGNIEKISTLSVQRYFSVTPQEAIAACEDAAKVYLGKGYIWGIECAETYHQLQNHPGMENIINLEPEGGGKTYLHNIGIGNETNRSFLLPEHSMIIGSTGVGKTELVKLMLAQNIQRNDEALVIIDPKGDRGLLDSIYKIAVHANREKDFRYFALAHPNKSETLNLFGNHLRANDVADRIRSIISAGASDFNNPFINFCWQVVHATADLMIACRIKITAESLYTYIVTSKKSLYEIAMAMYAQSLSEVEKDVFSKSMAHFKAKILDHDPSHMDKMVASLIPVLTVLGRGEIGRMLSPEVPSIQWPDTVNNRRIVYLSLSSMLDSFSSSAVGRLFVQDLVAYVGQQYAFQHVLNPVTLYVEEFYSLSFVGWVDILNKARAAGISALFSMQTSADITATLKKEITAQILTNTANKIFLRTPEIELAEDFSALFGEVQVPKRVITRSVNSAMDQTDNLFKSGMSERMDLTPVPLVSPTMLTTLPRGEAFIQTQGLPPIKLRIPLLDSGDIPVESFFDKLNPEVPLTVDELMAPEEGSVGEMDALSDFVGLSEEDFRT